MLINEVIKRGGGLRDNYDEILTGLHLSAALAAGWKRGTPQFTVK